MALDQQTLIARYQRGVSAGAQSYAEGVTGQGNKWKTNATSDAAEARYANGVNRAVAQRTRQKGVAAVSSATWEQNAREIGSQNYSRSAAKAATNYSAVAGDVIAAAQAGQNAAAALPGQDIASRLQKAVASATQIHRYWAQKKGVTPEV